MKHIVVIILIVISLLGSVCNESIELKLSNGGFIKLWYDNLEFTNTAIITIKYVFRGFNAKFSLIILREGIDVYKPIVLVEDVRSITNSISVRCFRGNRSIALGKLVVEGLDRVVMVKLYVNNITINVNGVEYKVTGLNLRNQNLTLALVLEPTMNSLSSNACVDIYFLSLIKDGISVELSPNKWRYFISGTASLHFYGHAIGATNTYPYNLTYICIAIPIAFILTFLLIRRFKP